MFIANRIRSLSKLSFTPGKTDNNQHMNKKINNPHDKFFKETFCRYEVFGSFFEIYVLERVGHQIRMDSLQLVQNDSVDSNYSEHFSDLVLQGQLAGTHSPVYFLLEHKSNPDPEIGNQLDDYMHVLRERYSKLHPSKSGYRLFQ